MEEKEEIIVKINREYMHFKGKKYIVEKIAYDCDTNEELVVYRQLYGDSSKTWVRKLSSFIEEIPERPDNITGQKYRFEEINKI